jgi:hypothetical protein
MNRFVDGTLIARDRDRVGRTPRPWLLDPLVNILVRCGILKEDLDYHLLRGAMVIYCSSSATKNGGRMRRRD